MSHVYRIKEVVKPNGPVSRSKLYADARAGLIELRKVGGMTIVHANDWARYVEGVPVTHRAARAA